MMPFEFEFERIKIGAMVLKRQQSITNAKDGIQVHLWQCKKETFNGKMNARNQA
jgi:hypothetical protein